MKIDNIKLTNFRNYKNLELDLDERRNIIVGEKFRNREFNILYEQFDPSETYTLVITDVQD